MNAWITRDNVNELIEQNGFQGPVDLLSLDLDGVDYWIWEAIEVVRPRVVIAEVQCIWGGDRAVTVPYSDAFKAPITDRFKAYCGASLPGIREPGSKKVIAWSAYNGWGSTPFSSPTGRAKNCCRKSISASCVDRPFVAWAQRELLPKVEKLEWVEV